MDMGIMMKAVRTYTMGILTLVLAVFALNASGQEPAWRFQVGGTLAGGNYVLRLHDGTQFQRPPSTGPIWATQLMASYRFSKNWGVSFGTQFLQFNYQYVLPVLLEDGSSAQFQQAYWDRWILLPVLANWEGSGRKLKYFAEAGTGLSTHLGTWGQTTVTGDVDYQGEETKVSDQITLGPLFLANAGIRYSLTRKLAARLSVGALVHLGFYSNSDFGYSSVLTGYNFNAGLAVEWQL